MMNNTEESIQKDKDNAVSSPDGSFDLPNDILGSSLDSDELQKLLGEAAVPEANDDQVMTGGGDEVSSTDAEHPASAIEELEKLYGVTEEVEPADMADDDLHAEDSLMAEIEALYGSNLENPSELDNQSEVDTVSPANEIEGATNEDTSGRDTLLEELEELFADSNNSGDTVPDQKMAEDISAEPAPDQQSALDELRAFLGESAQPDSGGNETSTSFEVDAALNSHRSVLDELQTLLQSCIDELKTDATAKTSASLTDTVYPSRDELQVLLETMLSQLLLYSDSPASDMTDKVSVLDELRSFMGDFETAGDDYASAEEAETTALEYSEYSEDIPDSDDSGDESVLDELDRYMAELSDDNSLHDEASFDEAVHDETYSYNSEQSVAIEGREDALAEDDAEDTADKSVQTETDTLAELEKMLGEIRAPNEGKSSEDEIDSTLYDEPEQSTASGTGDVYEDVDQAGSNISTLRHSTVKVVPAIKDKASDSTHLLSDDDDSGHMLKLGMVFTAVMAAVIMGIWMLLGSDSDNDYRSGTAQLGQSTRPETADVVKINLASSEPSEITHSATSGENPNTSDEQSRSQPGPEENPVVANTFETYTEEGALLQTEVAGGSRAADSYETQFEGEAGSDNDMQLKMLQQETQDRIELLDKRLSEAESSISMLQADNIEVKKLKDSADEAVYEDIYNEAEIDEINEAAETSEIVVETPEPQVPAKHKAIKYQALKPGLWTVHLSSYYGKPPSGDELSYLDKAGISYELRKAKINNKDWYRVVVDEFAEYEEAKKYADSIRGKVGRKDIWVNRSQ